MTPLPPNDHPQDAPTGSSNPRSFPIRYKVVLHRTPDKGLLFIIRTVMELTRYCREEASYRMWEALHRGCSQILVTHFERAELYEEQFTDRGLRVSIEPAA